MTTITKERIELFVKSPLENGLTRGEQMELARIALASLDAETVRYLNKFSGTCVTLEQQPNAADDVAVYIPLYTAPPAPVAPEKMNFSTACNFVQINGMAKEDRATLAMRAWNACRSAMLNGGKS
ncbi:Eaa protein [Salmonella enterica]|nr:Eaa protein [Salmonella enterica]